MASASPIQWNVVAALVYVKLNRDNHLLWQSQLESVMDSQDLLPFVDGTQAEPQKEITNDGKTEVNPKFVAWRRMDRLALSWIKATVTEAVLGHIMCTKTAQDAWSALEKSYVPFAGNAEAMGFSVDKEEGIKVAMEIFSKDANISPSNEWTNMLPINNINVTQLFANIVDEKGTRLERAMTFLRPTPP
ncbi:hypothetical protein EJ110_NYTH12237 [Nymphaea thermarum]|nr:hypothetical protein EJ110_NYTH12237 [Nymphaea thermarum]